MTTMAAMPIYGKNIKYFFSGTKRPMTLKSGMYHRVLKNYRVCSNGEPGLTRNYFTARSNLVPIAFVWEKGKTRDFSKTFAVYDVNFNRRSQLNECINLYEYQTSRLSIDLVSRSLTFSSFFFLETAGLIEAKFHVEPPWDEEVSIHIVYVTWPRWLPYPYIVNNLKLLFSGEKTPMTLNVGM